MCLIEACSSALVFCIYVQMCMHVILDVLCCNFCVLTHDCCILSCMGGTFLKFHYLNTLMRMNSMWTYSSSFLECLSKFGVSQMFCTVTKILADCYFPPSKIGLTGSGLDIVAWSQFALTINIPHQQLFMAILIIHLSVSWHCEPHNSRILR